MEQKRSDLLVPAPRSEGLVVEHLGGETLIYDLERDEAHHLNPTAAAVFEFCDGHTTPAELASKMAQRLGQPVSAETVDEAIAQLGERRLLTHAPPTGPGVSRREVVRKAGLVGAGAAVAGPVIKSIVAPTPAMAQSPGDRCETVDDCNSGLACEEGRCCVQEGGSCTTDECCPALTCEDLGGTTGFICIA